MRGGSAGLVRRLALLALLACLPGPHAAPDWADGAEASKQAAQQLAERHWHANLHRLQSLVLDERRVGELLGPIMGHAYTLPMPQVQKSLVYTGTNFRLRRVVHDLIVGKRTIKVGAVGGSITHGAKASKVGETDWFSLVGKYLKAAFPRAAISMRNGALPATPSALMNMCLEQYVDDDVDLVFVEYVANDGANRWGPGEQQRGGSVAHGYARSRARARLAQRQRRPAAAALNNNSSISRGEGNAQGGQHWQAAATPAAPTPAHERSHRSPCLLTNTLLRPGLTRSRPRCMSACCASCSTGVASPQSCCCS